MTALGHGADADAGGASSGALRSGDGVEGAADAPEDAESLLDVIPAPGTQYAEEEETSSSAGPGMLANIHMRLLDFLTWDRTRALRCPMEAKRDLYWRSLLPQVSWGTGGSSGLSSGASGPFGAAGASNGSQSGDAGGGWGGGSVPGGFHTADEEDFRGVPETTLPGLQDSRELLQASPHGWPELLRLLAMKREGILESAEALRAGLPLSAGGSADGAGRAYAERHRRRALLRAKHLDPLGEVLRILRHVARMEEARGFLSPPTDLEVDPDGQQTVGGMAAEGGECFEGGVSGRGKLGAGDAGGEGAASEAEGGEKGGKRIRRPLDIGTIMKRVESGWYETEGTSEVRPVRV